jgi:hypothetical protein
VILDLAYASVIAFAVVQYYRKPRVAKG